MNTADQSRLPKMSLFPKVALALLDWGAILAAIGLSYPTGLSLLGKVPFINEGVTLPDPWGRLASFGMFGLITAFFWLLHLVLRRSRLGQPFERRNVQTLYGLASMHLVYVLLTNGVLLGAFNWFRRLFSGQSVSLGGSISTDDFGKFFVGSGLLVTLTLFAFAAIFQRGVELREEEERLRAEQALTV